MKIFNPDDLPKPPRPDSATAASSTNDREKRRRLLLDLHAQAVDAIAELTADFLEQIE